MNSPENAQNMEEKTSMVIVAEDANELQGLQIFAERLRMSREKAGMQMQELADTLSVHVSTVSRWESGIAQPGLAVVATIAGKLEVSTDYLLGVADSDGSSQSMSINDRAKAILDRVREKSDEQALFFETTFRRYIEQITLLQKLKTAIDKNGILVTKKNVKGDGNLISNPALKDYVSVSAQANDTGKLLIRFVQEPLEDESVKDELEMFLSGR